jgi:hypothetical protein
MLGLIFLLVMNYYMFESNLYPHFLYSRRSQGMVTNISVILSLYASAAILIGILYRLKWMRVFGLSVLGLALAKVMLYDMHGLNLLYRVASFLVLGGLLIALSFLYTRFKDRLEGLAEPPPQDLGSPTAASETPTAPTGPGPQTNTEETK